MQSHGVEQLSTEHTWWEESLPLVVLIHAQMMIWWALNSLTPTLTSFLPLSLSLQPLKLHFPKPHSILSSHSCNVHTIPPFPLIVLLSPWYVSIPFPLTNLFPATLSCPLYGTFLSTTSSLMMSEIHVNPSSSVRRVLSPTLPMFLL